MTGARERDASTAERPSPAADEPGHGGAGDAAADAGETSPIPPHPVGTPPGPDGEPSSPSAVPPCPNCGAPVPDRYCPHCGQRYADAIPSLRRMFADFVDDQFSVNGRLPRSILALVARPGHLTREYSAGRITRYIRPFRLFLISSVLFFIALSFVADPVRMMSRFEAEVGPIEELQQSENYRNVNIPIDTAGVPGWLRPAARRLALQEARLNSMPPQESMRVITAGFLDAAPKLAFALVPAFALLLLALHHRRRPRYVEHFVFALHYHAMAFLLMAPALLLGNPYVWGAVGTWIMLYLLIALRTAYRQPWWLATVKFMAILTIYPTVMTLGITLLSMLTFLFV